MNQSPDLHAVSIIGSCCGNEAWRGRLCQYHEGYEDGYKAAQRDEAELQQRDEAWKKLVRYLIEENGFAPPIDAKGLWVDLYDEVTT